MKRTMTNLEIFNQKRLLEEVGRVPTLPIKMILVRNVKILGDLSSKFTDKRQEEFEKVVKLNQLGEPVVLPEHDYKVDENGKRTGGPSHYAHYDYETEEAKEKFLEWNQAWAEKTHKVELKTVKLSKKIIVQTKDDEGASVNKEMTLEDYFDLPDNGLAVPAISVLMDTCIEE